MRYLTAGFSHGAAYAAVLEGLPAGFSIDENLINSQLKRRQGGLGRSQRMGVEYDRIRIISGLIDGKTVGAPLAFSVTNKLRDRVPFSVPRPGHADFAGALKYGFTDDVSLVSERASGRETVMAVAIGSICKQFLSLLGISVKSRAVNIGGIDFKETAAIKDLIDKVRADGDTLGGRGEVVISNAITGLGSYVSRDRKLDGRLAAAVMSVPSVKAVEFGLGFGFENLLGSQCMDSITLSGRGSNNAGGIEGGMTNGQDVIIGFAIKPVPTLGRGISSVDFKTKSAAITKPLRSDVCAVESVTTSAEAVCAYEILDEILHCFGGDTAEEVVERYNAKKCLLAR